MAIRELITLLGYEVDPKGINEYQKKVTDALSGIRKQVGFIGGLVGAELAFSTVKSFVTGLAQNIRTANKLGKQMEQAIAPGESSQLVMDHLFSVAQDLGDEFTGVASRFKDMVSGARAFGLSTDTTMAAFENISKTMEVSRMSSEDVESSWQKINIAIARGGLSARALAEFTRTSPRLLDVLIENLGITATKTKTARQVLSDLTAQGKITSEVLVKGFSRVNATLDQDFLNKPDTLGEAFNYAYNEMVRVGQQLWKITYASRTLATGIRWLTNTIVSFGKQFVEAMGGVENVLELVKAAIIGAFGYYSVGLIITFISYITKLGNAALFAQLKFAAIAAAIVGIGLVIQDFMSWISGNTKDSFFGRLLGPAADYQKHIDNIIKPFTALKQIFTGDFSGGFASLKEAIGSLEGFITTGLLATIALVIPAIRLWNIGVSFANLISAITGVVTETKGVATAAETTAKAIGSWNEISLTKLIGMLVTGSPLMLAIVGVGAAVILIATHWDEVKQAGIDALDGIESAANRVKQTWKEFIEGTPATEEQKQLYPTQTGDLGGAWKGQIEANKNAVLGGYEPQVIPGGPGGAWATPIPVPPIPVVPISKDQPISVEPVKPPEQPAFSWLQRNMPTWLGGENTVPVVPSAAPGDIAAAPVSNTQTNNVPITNNVNVTVPAEFGELEFTITNKINEATQRMQDDTTRQLTRSMPRFEAATGQ